MESPRTPKTVDALSTVFTELFAKLDDTRHDTILTQLLSARAALPEKEDDVFSAAFKRARLRKGFKPISATPSDLTSALETDDFKKNYRLLVHARGRRRRAEMTPSFADLTYTIKLLIYHASNGDVRHFNDYPLFVDYETYGMVAKRVQYTLARMRPLFSASSYLRLPRDPSDRVTVRVLVRYLHGQVMLFNAWRRLSSFETESDGYIRENDLENYIFTAIAELPDLQPLSEVFYPFYVFTSSRKFCFMLDPNRTGKIQTAELVASKVFWEWLQLFPVWHVDIGGSGVDERLPPWPTMKVPPERLVAFADSPTSNTSPGRTASGETVDRAAAAKMDPAYEALLEEIAENMLYSMHPEVSKTAWFSSANAIKVYSSYLDLDTDQNGLLSQAELSRFNGATLTDAFLRRVFQEVHTYNGEMDYKAFLDFTLAMEYRTSTASLRYIFTMLDVHKRGYLTVADIRYWFGEVVAKLHASGQEDMYNVSDVSDEVFDMVSPAKPDRIDLEDLKKCRVGHSVLHMLTDVAGFWQYDNRESLLHQQQQARDAGESPPIPTDLSHLDER